MLSCIWDVVLCAITCMTIISKREREREGERERAIYLNVCAFVCLLSSVSSFWCIWYTGDTLVGVIQRICN